MSHITAVDVEVTDLDALEAACLGLGLELRRGQKTFRYYGRVVGDYALPEGMTAADAGKCEHAIRVKGDPRAYEIGLVRRTDGRPGWRLAFDFWSGGFGLMAHISKDGAHGQDAAKLVAEYGAVKAIRHGSRLGMRHELKRSPNGMAEKLRIFR